MGYWLAMPRFAPGGARLLRTWTVGALLALAPMVVATPDDPSPTAQPSPDASAGPSAGPSAEPSAPPAELPLINSLKAVDDPCVGDSPLVVDEEPWTHRALGLPDLHSLSRGEGTTVAVLATGVDGDAPALAGALEGAGPDCLGFGTFIAGVVAARAQPGDGFMGVAPGAQLVGVPTGAPQTGITTAAQIASGIAEAVDAGADVILVGTAAWIGSAALDEAVAAADAAGALVVAPATAVGPDGPLPGYPAQNPSVLSVAAHTTTGEPVLAEPLPVADGEFARVDVVAPGDRVLGVGPGGGHFVSVGDGVAAAFAAGAAALLRSSEPALTGAQIRDRLMRTAYASSLGSDDVINGHGRIDPAGALTDDPSGAANTVPGERFVPDPSSRGWVSMPSTVAVAGVAGFVIVLCALGGAVLRGGRARGWRPAAPGEPIEPESDLPRRF